MKPRWKNLRDRRSSNRVTAVMALVLAVLASLTLAPSATAATSRGPCYYFDFDGVRFHNYDYLSNAAFCNNVDWTTNLMFYNNATINSVKRALLHAGGYSSASTDGMHMEVRTNYGGWWWDRDTGMKQNPCPGIGSTTPHYRVYAPPDRDYMYTINIGYFVVGTTHRDKNECPPIGKTHYNTEQVEGEIAAAMRSSGYQVDEDWADYYNWEPYRVEGNHIWESNGYATYIRMP